jgi:cell division protein FtsW (lipid II flippase)
MGHLRENWWRWVRGLLALLLAYLVIGAAVMHSGRIVWDTSVNPPTHQIVERMPGILVGIAIAVFALACVFVSMWKRWDFEVVGWVLLLVFVFLGMAH